jgi:hypothetical protein
VEGIRNWPLGARALLVALAAVAGVGVGVLLASLVIGGFGWSPVLVAGLPAGPVAAGFFLLIERAGRRNG